MRIEFDPDRATAEAFARSPAAKRLPGDIRPFTVAQPNDIDECALRGINKDRKLIADTEPLSTELERLPGEDVNLDRLAQRWNAATAGERNIDARRNDVRQFVAGKCSNQAGRALRRPMGNFQ